MSINQTYILSALLLHSTQQEVTVEAIQKIFKHLNLPVDEKLAQKFVLPTYTYENLCKLSSNTSNTTTVETAVKEVKAEIVEEPSEEVDMDGFF